MSIIMITNSLLLKTCKHNLLLQYFKACYHILIIILQNNQPFTKNSKEEIKLDTINMY